MTLPNSLSARDRAAMIHPFTQLKKHQETGPMIITRAEGVHVFDESGKRYLEAFSGLWCTSLGFSEERLIAAAEKQLRTLPYYHHFTHKSVDVTIELAEKIIEMSPKSMSKVFFTNSGSEANDTAVKLVWYINNAKGRPAKKKIIAREKSYHGVTAMAASLTGLPHLHADFDLPFPQFKHTMCPNSYRFGKLGETDEQFVARCADELEKLIIAEGGAEQVAAFWAEPFSGAGGVHIPPKGYYEAIQPILKKYDIMLISDEVICGFGRTGEMWGCQTFNMQPDMMIAAKQLSAGYLPIGAVLVSEEINQILLTQSEKIGTFGHGFTYSGHPVCAAVALETLKIYEERDMLGHVKRLSPRMMAGLQRFADHPLVGNVRGVGLVGAVELVADKATRAPFDPALKVGPYCFERAQEHGLIIRAMGDTLGFCPPLVFNEDQIDEMLALFGKALDDTARYVAGVKQAA